MPKNVKLLLFDWPDDALLLTIILSRLIFHLRFSMTTTCKS